MSNAREDWSPADNSYAIAVSEARWWLSAVNLAAARLSVPADRRAAPMSSIQIDARTLVFALTQLLTAEQLEQYALKDLSMDPRVGETLAIARDRFLQQVPGIREMRNAITHFEDWSRGKDEALSAWRWRPARINATLRAYSGASPTIQLTTTFG